MPTVNEKTKTLTSKLTLHHKSLEEDADAIVHMFRSSSHRDRLSGCGHHVKMIHIRMSEKLFSEIAFIQSKFSAFRCTQYKTPSLLQRGVLGMLCGVHVHRDDSLRDVVVFQYKNVQAEEAFDGVSSYLHFHGATSNLSDLI